MPAHDPARRRRSIRRGSEKGAWVYITAADLEAAGFEPGSPPPWYRMWPRKTGRAVLVQLYREG